MTMKRQKTLHRFAAVAAVLIAFCLVFMMPVGAEVYEDCLGNCQHVAAIGTTHYDTLQEAVADVTTTTQTEIELLKTVTGPGVVIGEGTSYLCNCEKTTPGHPENCGQPIIISNAQNIIIDFNGYTYTAEYGIGSAGTSSMAFQLKQGSTVVLRNGTISSNSDYKVKRLIQNYADLTLEEITLDGTNLPVGYVANTNPQEVALSLVLSNNCGNVVIDSTTIYEATTDGHTAGTAAFDVCDYYGSGVSVTVNGNSNIVGDVICESNGDTSLTINGGTFTDPTVLNYLGENAQVTVSLSKDVTLPSEVCITNGKTVELKLNGHTITGPSDGWAFTVGRGSGEEPLTIEFNIDGSVKDSKIKDGTIALSNGIITSTITGGTYEMSMDNQAALQSNGNPGNWYTISVSDATISSSNNIALYLPGKGTYSFENSKITGTTGIYMKAGELTVTDGEITATGSYAEPTPDGSGASSTGDGIILDSKQGYQGDMKLTLTGVTITSLNGYAVHEALTDLSNTETVSLSINDGKYTGEKGAVFASEAFDNAVSEGKATVSIAKGEFSSEVKDAYLAENCVCVANGENSFVVMEKDENTVVPELPVGTVTDTSIEVTDGATITTETVNGKSFVNITSTDPATGYIVTVLVSGATHSENTVTTTADSEYHVIFGGTNAAVNSGFVLEIQVDDITHALPVIQLDIKDDVKTSLKAQYPDATNVLAMVTAAEENLDAANNNIVGKDLILAFIVQGFAVQNPDNLVAYHVGTTGVTKFEIDPENVEYDEVNNIYTVYIESNLGFSSYVLVEEEPVADEGEPLPPQTTGGSATDTGSGNYQYYPRSVPTDGIVDFGTSKVVTGMELPAGSDGTVTLNIKPTFAMPENGFYAFEIDAPGYNTDAKINGGLSFQIPVADLEAAGWTAEDIVLFHGTVGEDGKITWEALPTNLVKNENGVAYYKAAINGCSPFYIGFVKDGSVVNTEVVDPTTPETPETPVTPDEPEVLPPVDEPETPEQPTESPAPILAVLAGLGAAVVLRRK